MPRICCSRISLADCSCFADKLMLSIGKLSHLVHMQETNVLDDDAVMDGASLLYTRLVL